MKNLTLTSARDARRIEFLELKKNMSVQDIMKLKGLSRARLYQIIGPTRHILKSRTTSTLLSVYRFIEAYRAEHGYSPAIAEIADKFPDYKGERRSTSVIHFWLDKMRSPELDMLEPKQDNVARSIVLKPLNKKLPAIREMLKLEKETENGTNN